MSIFNIDAEKDYKLQGKSAGGLTISQGNNVVFLPPEVVEKIKAAK